MKILQLIFKIENSSQEKKEEEYIGYEWAERPYIEYLMCIG